MRCSNCGNELKDGTLVCPRCGARQKNSNNIKHQDGSGGNGGFGKIIAIVVSLVLVAGASLFIANKINSNKKTNYFTHNIDFDKDNLTVQDEQTLRYREVPSTQTFSIGSSKGFVNVDIVDEMGDKVNYVVDKTVKNDRYVIKPKDVWDNTHTYYLSLGEDTYFTDEAMYKFNKLIYTIKRGNVAEFKYNNNIKNIVENPNEVVNEGDLVIVKDEDGRLVCRKVKSKANGKNIYETPDLTEVFEELNLHSTIQPNLREIFSDYNTKKQLLYNILNSKFFDFFVMTTYAAENDLPDGFELAQNEIKSSIVKDVKSGSLLDALEVKVSAGNKKEVLGNFEIKFELTDPKKYSRGLGFDITLTRKHEVSKEAKSVKPIEDAVDNTPIKYDKIKSGKNTLKLSFEIDAPTIVPDIDINNHKFDISYSTDMNLDIDFNFDFVNIKDEFEKESESILICHSPISSGIPCIILFFDISFEPEIKSNGTVGAKYSKKVVIANGLTYEHGVGFKEQKLCTSDEGLNSDKFSMYVKGKLEAEAPLKVSFGVKIALLSDKDIDAFKKLPWLAWINDMKKKLAKFTEVGYLDLYGKVGLFFEIEGKLNGEIEFPQKDYNVDFELSLGAGVLYKAGVEGELKIEFAELKADAELVFVDGKWYLFKYNKEIPIASSSNTQFVTVDVADEGNYMKFGKYDYLVLKKDPSTGKALLTSKEGVSTKPYSEKVDYGAGVTWAQSTLRMYLNDAFFNNEGGFSNTEKEAIYKTIVKPDDNQSIKGGAATTDKIFILSKSELESYFNSNEMRELKASSQALGEGAYVCPVEEQGTNKKIGNTVYWVRTPGNMNTKAMVVNSNGSIAEDGVNVTGPDNIDGVKGKVCVRPALWVN